MPGRCATAGWTRVFGENAALLDAGAHLLALTPDATLHVLKKDGDRLVPAAKYTVADGATWAAPALARNKIAVKDINSVFLWELPR